VPSLQARPAHVVKWLSHSDATAVERDVHSRRYSGVQSELRSGKACPSTKDLFHNNSYAHDDHGDDPGQVIKGSTVSSKICDRCRHLD